MGLVYKLLTLHGTKKSASFEALFDTGAEMNVCGWVIPGNINLFELGPSDIIFDVVVEGVGNNLIEGDAAIFPRLEIDQKAIRNVQFFLLDGYHEPIIGVETMQAFGLRIDMGADRVFL